MFRKNNNNASVFGRKVAAPIRRFGAKISTVPRMGPSYGNMDKPPQPKLEKI
jgi:hypothetical protein